MRINPANIDLPPEKLGKLLESASACAVGLLLVGADQFTITAGDLSKKGFDQMRQSLQKYWPASTQHDLNRYVGLYLDERFFYLFAKFLPQSDIILSLLFNPQTPLVRIRQDMTNMMRGVVGNNRAQKPADQDLERSLQFVLKPHPAPDPKEQIPSQPAGGRVVLEDRTPRNKEETVPDQTIPKIPDQPPEWRPLRDSGGNVQVPSSNNQSLADLPSGEVWVPLDEILSGSKDLSPKGKSGQEGSSGPSTSSSQDSLVEQPSTRRPGEWQPLEEARQPEPDLVGLFHEDLDLQRIPSSPEEDTLSSDDPIETYAESVIEVSDEETRPHVVDEEEEFDQIKLSDITFYLVPRQNRHYILGELAQRLRGWFPGICETYGWQLDHLSVRPDYVKWRLHDFPDALIHEMLEIVRKRTSERIFRVFPNLREGNPTDDFWSPGYLVDRQNQDFSTQILIATVKPGRNSDPED